MSASGRARGRAWPKGYAQTAADVGYFLAIAGRTLPDAERANAQQFRSGQALAPLLG